MKISVLGAGSWGIALSNLLSINGHLISLWEFEPTAYENLIKNREVPDKLKAVKVEKGIDISNSLEETLSGSQLWVIAVPSQFIRNLAKKINLIYSNPPNDFKAIVNVAKGFEVDSLLPLSSVVKEELIWLTDPQYVCLCGPSHAEEVARSLPTTIVAACPSGETSKEIQEIFGTHFFRVYSNRDLIGVEVVSSLKNVIAIAAGICDGLGFGDNAKGALLTRGMVEMARLVKAMGGEPQTCFGLSGMGDLITTCISRHSRNRFVGEEIGKGKTLEVILSGMTMVAEGVKTAQCVLALSQKHQIEMPITEQVNQVIFKNKDPLEAVESLMLRELKAEELKN